MHAIRYGLKRHIEATKDKDISQSKVFKESDKTYKNYAREVEKNMAKVPCSAKKAVSEEDMAK